MTNQMQFKRAIKLDARGRVALVGPPGSGKSYTALKLARLLAGPNGKIAALDTEHGSLSKYADAFDFDVIELDSFTPDQFLGALDAAEANKYDVFCADSLSHFWMGLGGALEFVDEHSRRNQGRSADTFAAWKDWRPYERLMVDRMIASPCHVIVTMRTKTEYVEEVNERGKKVRRKVGLAPVQREGLEYEFDLVGYMDDDNTLLVDKTRCSAYVGRTIAKPGEKEFEPFREWLKGTKRDISAPARSSEPMPRNGNGSVRHVAAAVRTEPPLKVQELWRTMKKDRESFNRVFADARAALENIFGKETGNAKYVDALHRHNIKSAESYKGNFTEPNQAVLELFNIIRAAEPAIVEEAVPGEVHA
jgi:energy-coupling factor transporter ATP-binding protein EcfA2